ncbi:hypothetical protein [Mycolicibacter minnesotensis]
MPTRSDRWGNPRGQPPQRVVAAHPSVGRWEARRMSRRFADVGVRIPPDRLRRLSVGAPLVSAESVDYAFALAATEMRREQRLARAQRNRRRLVHVLIVLGLMVAALNLLICLGYVFICLVLREPAM